MPSVLANQTEETIGALGNDRETSEARNKC